MILSSDPRLGDRLPNACSKEHLAALYDHYRRRPFVQEELWAGRIARALENTTGELTAKDLTDATGLNLEQIERCRAWLEAQLYRHAAAPGGAASDTRR
ncbi:hypothetical protein [Nonomuraea sediminis]|uniref:hypothetical protein n=1 Tax=Nonomuraea sediminis TaxID=2835864 RepID=UPI001BDCDF44|nr:hypothetical protein [Nonomuraea sediminis]